MLSRREALAALASAAALPLMSGCARHSAAPASPPATGETDAVALLDGVGDNLLRLFPETATSLGIDTGERAALRFQLADHSAEGQQRLAQQVRADLDRVNADNTSGLSHAARTSVEVVRSAYANGTINVLSEPEDRAIVVPLTAVFTEDESDYDFVSIGGNRYQKRAVKIGLRLKDKAVIEEGLTSLERFFSLREPT